jgi:hypothetical protein
MAIRTSEDFYQAVRVMRETQKEYFKGRSPLILRLSKKQEAEIDRFIRERDRRLADQKQGVLFGGRE